MATLATGIYRPWFWANYKGNGQQAALRSEWSLAIARFTQYEIREGLSRWANQFGADHPPTPLAFADFIKPVHSSGSRAFFSDMKQVLS